MAECKHKTGNAYKDSDNIYCDDCGKIIAKWSEWEKKVCKIQKGDVR